MGSSSILPGHLPRAPLESPLSMFFLESLRSQRLNFTLAQQSQAGEL